jgi:cobalt-zinc-cadmium efflux system membrane fusion protein
MKTTHRVHAGGATTLTALAALIWSVGLGISAAGCSDRQSEATEAGASGGRGAATHVLGLSAEQIRHGAVRWAAVEPVELASSVETAGQLVPDDDRTARLGAPARGRVMTIHVNVGDHVSAGQALVTIQSQEAATALADQSKAAAELNSRQAAANFSRAAYERAVRLLELKAVARQEVERARTDAELAQAAVSEAQAEVERARAILTQLGVDATGELVLRTPIAGVVLKREAVPGSVVDAGTPLITVTDPSTLWLQAAATESLATPFRTGADIHFTVSAFPGERFDARVQNVGAGLDPATRTLLVRALVRNPSRRLRPEMFATVWLGDGKVRTAFLVPEGAIQLLDERPVVFVSTPSNGTTQFERRDVEVGARTDGKAEIVKGLHAGDLVVTDGAFAVKSEFARSKIPSES